MLIDNYVHDFYIVFNESVDIVAIYYLIKKYIFYFDMMENIFGMESQYLHLHLKIDLYEADLVLFYCPRFCAFQEERGLKVKDDFIRLTLPHLI